MSYQLRDNTLETKLFDLFNFIGQHELLIEK